MFGSSILEIAVGVIFVYLVLSLICSAVNEAIATLINKRGKNLFEGVKNLLNDPTFTGLAQQVYNHGLVDGISQDATNPAKHNRRPSYMPSETFSLALLDILGSQGVVSAAHVEALTQAEDADDAYQELLNTPGADPNKISAAKAARDAGREALVKAETDAKTAYDTEVTAGGATPNDAQLKAIADAKTRLDTASAAIKILDARRAAVASAGDPKNQELIQEASEALEQSLAAGRMIAAGLPNQIENIQAAVGRLPDGHTKETLLVLIDKSKREAAVIGDEALRLRQEVQQFQQNVEGWFNDAMDRVGGWYKRWTQAWQLALAIIIVLLLNADTVMLTKRFSTDKDLRAAVLQQAEKVNEKETVEKFSESASKNIAAYGLPIGWSNNWKDSRRFPWLVDAGEESPFFVGLWQIFIKLLGLIITIGAVSMGAPFWFDMLSKVINIRGAGTPPGEKKKSAGDTTNAAAT